MASMGKWPASQHYSLSTSSGYRGSVDLDWLYPQADDLGGVKADTANYVALFKEMRAALGSR